MANEFDYEVLTAEKPEGVTVAQALAGIQAQYPDHHVVIEDLGNEFQATLARKSKVSRTVVAADDDALDLLDDAPPAPGKEAPGDGPGAPKEEKDEAPEDEPKEEEGKEEKEEKDKGEGDDDDGNPVSQIIDALKTLEKLLPKVKEQLGGIGADVVDAPIPDEALGPMPGGPHDGPPDIGPTPGAPPGAALPKGIPGGGAPGGPPGGFPGGPAGGPPGRGGPKPDLRRKPSVGVPTFGSAQRRSKVVFRPILNEDGTSATVGQVASELETHPRYAAYEVKEVKEEGPNYVAYLKLREE